ncbi:hypothetical protein [Flavobacterium sp. 2]|uniref:hypothetical protein n=1 Tax=Flavobacterium sp. 2 TaxID=308053 RepID=UPI000C18920C|nr:hypothetical protein [Flavobacterium sp. 2]PIF69457.1 hypothetical protein CLU99_0162 [Flavobacterium sp. 2]
MVVNIRGIQQFDLQNPSDSIDYLCYLTEDKYSLVNITLINDPDSRLLSNFQEDFMIEKRETYKYLLCYHYSHNLYYTFVNPTNKFIFNDYFFNNLNSTNPEKKSRLNLLLNNIENLIKEILVNTEKNNLDISNYLDINELEKEFEIKFKSTFVISQDYDSQPLKVYNYPFNLLLFCLGINLKKIYDKLRLEYSGYLENSSSSTYQPSNNSKNQTNSFFSSEKPYSSNFEML